jgi:hypothetical protein
MLYQMIRQNDGWEMFKMIEMLNILVTINEKPKKKKMKC